jgi:hypothetical protein
LESTAHSTTWFGVTVDPAGRAVAVGRREGAGPAVARFDATGAPDEDFNATWLASLPVGRLGVGPRLAFSAVADAAGVLVVGSDNYTEFGEANLGFALRLNDQGEVDTGFATGGVYRSESLHGCFDVARDGDGWVLGCISLLAQAVPPDGAEHGDPVDPRAPRRLGHVAARLVQHRAEVGRSKRSQRGCLASRSGIAR